MRIGLDCRLSGPAHAGIGRYTTNLMQRLPALAPDIEWVYFVNEVSQASQVHDFANVEVRVAPIRHYSLAEQLKMPALFTAAKLDLLHVPHFNIPVWYSGLLVVTIHDLLWHEYRGLHVTTLPAWKYWLKYSVYRWVVSRAVDKSQVILVPANTIKKTLTKYYPAVETKIVITHEGVDTSFTPVKEKISQESHQLLYVGSLYPHKNIKLVVEALHYLPEYTLVIAGSRTVFQDELKRWVDEQKLTNRVIFKGYVSDKALAQLYTQVEAVVQPSFFEGFGLTGVEAMSQGVPVLAANIPIFQEIYQDGALFFDPHSPQSFKKAVQELASSDRQSLIKKGLKVARQYSWDKMTAQTLAAYTQAVSKNS